MSNWKLTLIVALLAIAGIFLYWPTNDNSSDQQAPDSGAALTRTAAPVKELLARKPAEASPTIAVASKKSLPAESVAAMPKMPVLSTPENPDETPPSQMGGPETTMDLSGPEHAPGYGQTSEPGSAPRASPPGVAGLAPLVGGPEAASPPPNGSNLNPD